MNEPEQPRYMKAVDLLYLGVIPTTMERTMATALEKIANKTNHKKEN